MGALTHFTSHAWARPFGLLVESLQGYFAGAPERSSFGSTVRRRRPLWGAYRAPSQHPRLTAPSRRARFSRPRTAVFAINQDYGRAMVELDDGKTLARVVEMSAATLVVLDGEVFALSRLWCLYEIGSTPLHKLELITPGGDAAQAIGGAAVDAERHCGACASPHGTRPEWPTRGATARPNQRADPHAFPALPTASPTRIAR